MRLPHPMGLSGPTSWLPPTRQTAREAVDSGLVSAETAAELGYAGLPVSDRAAPELAVLAGRAALTATGLPADRVGLLLHAWIHYQGHDLWSPAHYLADRLGLSHAVPIGVQQVCNGGAAAIELAVARLLIEPTLDHALVTTADRFADEGFDRWAGDYGIGYGDGATALLVHRPDDRAPDLLLHAVRTVAAPQLERMHRGRDPFSAAPRSISRRVDLRRTKKAFLEDVGMETFTKAGVDGLRTAIEGCLADAGTTGDDPRLRYAVPPRLGRTVVDTVYAPIIREHLAAEILPMGGDSGHLGAGDAAASLAELHRGRRLAPGQRALIVSAGAGFTWSCLLVEAT